MKNLKLFISALVMFTWQNVAISQLTLHSMRINVGQDYGLNKTTWSTQVQNGYRNYYEMPAYRSFQTGVEGVIKLGWVHLTVGYNFQNSDLIHDYFEFSESIKEHQFLIGCMAEQVDLNTGVGMYLGFKTGFNKMHASSIHASMLNYSTPADIEASYVGFVTEVELGAMYQRKNSPLYFALVPNISHSYNEIYRVKTAPEDGQYSATGKSRTLAVGMKFVLGVRLLDLKK
jgi:hypothetical protein